MRTTKAGGANLRVGATGLLRRQVERVPGTGKQVPASIGALKIRVRTTHAQTTPAGVPLKVPTVLLPRFRDKGTIPHPPPLLGEVAVVSKAEKQSLRYSDYYWCMSLKDFIEWVEADDDNEPGTSFSDRT